MRTVEDVDVAETLATIERFNEAFNRHDVDGIMAVMTDDCRFENSYPPPDGLYFNGQAEVRAYWENLFAEEPTGQWEAEDIFAVGDRCVVLWINRWNNQQDGPGHIRGVDVFRVRDGKVAEKFAYIKG
jgi:ketosteroid isomerase-like protein